jgi:hypothetical protein
MINVRRQGLDYGMLRIIDNLGIRGNKNISAPTNHLRSIDTRSAGAADSTGESPGFP